MSGTIAVAPWEGDENAPNSCGSIEAASACIRELADPRPGGESVKTAIGRASDLSGLPYWRAFDIWYRKARRIEGFEQEAIAAALTKKHRLDAQREFIELHSRMARLEAALTRIDPDFHRETLERLRGIAKR